MDQIIQIPPALLLLFLGIEPMARIMVNGHGLLTVPSSKNGGTVSTPLESTSRHYEAASYGIIDKAFFDSDHSVTPWKRPGDFGWKEARDLIHNHPQTLHPCGCNAAVDVKECAGVVRATGFGETTLGGTVDPPTWARGSSQETAWNMWVNHGGGHLYSVCKKTNFDNCRDITLPEYGHATREETDNYLECVWECFNSNVLEWEVGVDQDWRQKLQFRNDGCSYVKMDPQTKKGKDGHMWRFSPVPDSLQVTNGGEGRCTWDSVVSFSGPDVRDEFVASFGDESVCDWGTDSHAPPDWHVFDKVKVPMELEEGEYLLSWRWDAYTADQMWTSCADITIAPPDATATNDKSEKDNEDCSSTPMTPRPTTKPTNAPAPPPSPSGEPSCPLGYTGVRPLDSCTKYHHCQNGQVTGAVHDCPPGTLFDVQFGYCNWDNLVTCEEEQQGCYSNNLRDCNHPDFDHEGASCDTTWLPEGARNSCIALWGSCTNNSNGESCCEPAVCHSSEDGSRGQCVIV